MTIPTRKEAFAAIVKLLNLKFEEAPAPVVVATDYPLKDGGSVSIDTLAIGGVVTKDAAPVMDGGIVLEDGTTITTVGGIITEVEAKEEAQPEAPEELASGIADTMKKMKADIEAMKKELGGYGSSFAQLVAENDTLRQANLKTVELMEQIAADPIEKPAEFTTVPKPATSFQKFQEEKKSRWETAATV